MYKTFWQQIAVQQVSDGRKTQGEHKRTSNRSNSHRGRRRVRQPQALILLESCGFQQNLDRVAVAGKQVFFVAWAHSAKPHFPQNTVPQEERSSGGNDSLDVLSLSRTAPQILLSARRSSWFSNFFHDSCLAQASLPFVPSIIARLAASNPLRCP